MRVILSIGIHPVHNHHQHFIGIRMCRNCADSCPSMATDPNPFGSYRHEGSFPESLFDCTSESQFEESTHIYVNVDASSEGSLHRGRAESFQNPTSSECSLSLASNCTAMPNQPTQHHGHRTVGPFCNLHDPVQKVESWLHNCPHTELPTTSVEGVSLKNFLKVKKRQLKPKFNKNIGHMEHYRHLPNYTMKQLAIF